MINLLRRLWTYQAERFPLATHGTLVAALVIGGAGYATAGTAWPGWATVAALFVVTLGSFLLLRLLDEHKDAADDAAYRPYRPVPRGLVTLAELRGVAVVVALVQVVLTWALGAWLLPYLLVVWAGLGILAREFFVNDWLRARPLAYMFSHMIVLPLLFLYILAGARGAVMPPGTGWFLPAAYANGLVFEIGRKLRHPAAEEPGVETYSALWGVGRAATAWAAALLAAGAAASGAGWAIGVVWPVVAWAGCGGLVAVWTAWRMAQQPSKAGSRRIEMVSALWVLTLYLLLGIAGHL